VDPRELEAQKLTLRTVHGDKFAQNARDRFLDAAGPGVAAIQANRRRRDSGAIERHKARRCSYDSTFLNELLAADDANHLAQGKKDGDEIPGFCLVIGRITYNTKSSSAKADIEYLSRFVPVFLIDENYSSQVSLR
jgi:hypothetical protein